MAGEAPRRNEWPLALSLLVAATGLVVLTFYNWRNGVLVFAGSVLLAGLLRVSLSDSAAGLLHVRGRMFDTALLIGVGLAIGTLALIVPN
ncbi:MULTISPECIES: DUF3017 domain-containing protein [unclassified Kribbella]|uniref:DUF3017 domain-containing protein n=1 Tax=unclassified Kribbella TaxID=2644121 RepID=UPI0030174685